MTESEFNLVADNTLRAIEDALDSLETEIDYDASGGLLTLEFDNGSKVIINRQPATQQLWIAAKSGGFQLDYEAGQQRWWCPNEQQDLLALLNRLCSEQAEEAVVLTL